MVEKLEDGPIPGSSFEIAFFGSGWITVALFAREFFLMKKLEMEKTKPVFNISVLKVEF